MKSWMVATIAFLGGALIALIARASSVRPAVVPAAKSEAVPIQALKKVTDLAEPAACAMSQGPDSEGATAIERDCLGKPAEDRRTILSLKEWNDFYAAVDALKLSQPQVERLLFDRLQRDFGWTDELRRQLQDLFDREQEAATVAVVSKYGTSIMGVVELPPADRQRAWQDLLGIREGVRRQFDAAYARHLEEPEHRLMFDRHLRNEVLFVQHTSLPGHGEGVLIVGVGDPEARQ